MSLYAGLLRAVGHRRWFTAGAARLAPVLDRWVYRLSGRRRVATPKSIPTMFLTTTGRVTGARHTVPVSFVEDDDSMVVVGTNWGRAPHPEWTWNLLVNPRADIEYHGKTWTAAARLVESPLRAGFWDQLDAMWPPYATYRERAPRTIRMFRLTPVESLPDG